MGEISNRSCKLAVVIEEIPKNSLEDFKLKRNVLFQIQYVAKFNLQIWKQVHSIVFIDMKIDLMSKKE